MARATIRRMLTPIRLGQTGERQAATAAAIADAGPHHQPGPLFEKGLVQALEPIRGFALAAVLLQFFDSGLFDAIRDSGAVSADELASRRGLDPDRILVLLHYLAVEGFVTEAAGRFAITDKA